MRFSEIESRVVIRRQQTNNSGRKVFLINFNPIRPFTEARPLVKHSAFHFGETFISEKSKLKFSPISPNFLL